ncbi:MAG: universal stress protein [Archangiaceae bacterium]|nr:universal stress protein [Archangiaceae bacterium]
MKTLRKVLCAVDLGPRGDEALCQGDALARLHGARLTAFHSLQSFARSAPLFSHLELARREAFVAVERRVLTALTERVRAVTGRGPDDSEVALGSGAPHSAIIEAARRLLPDVLVLGSGPPHLGVDALLGSTAERVIRYAGCPVLVARPCTATGPVLAATDFSDPSLPAIDAAIEVARRAGAGVIALHALGIDPAVALSTMNGVAWPALDPREVESLRATALRQLSRALARFGACGECLVSERAPTAAILEHAEKSGTRLLCVGTTGRNGLSRLALGSVADDVVRRAPCPVLVVRLTRRRPGWFMPPGEPDRADADPDALPGLPLSP